MSPPAKIKKDRKPKVCWTAEEFRTVIGAAVLASFEDTDHIWAYLAIGQKVLPEDRRRIITGKHVVNRKVLAAFEEARRTLLDRPAPIVEAIPQVPVPVPVELTRAQIIDGLSNEELIQLAVKRLKPIMDGLCALGGQGGREGHTHGQPSVPEPEAPASPNPITPAPASAPKPVKATKVFLFGFAPDQETEIRGKASGFNLQLLFARQPRGEEPPKVPVCDWCIVADPDLSRRMGKAIKLRVDDKHTFYIRSVETTMQKLADINSRTK